MQLWYWSFSQSEFELPRLDLWRFYSQIIVRKYCSLIGSVATTREISTTCVSLFTLEISTVFEIPVLSLQSCILSTETAFLTLVKKKKKARNLHCRRHLQLICSRKEWKTTRGEESKQTVFTHILPWIQHAGGQLGVLANLYLAREDCNLSHTRSLLIVFHPTGHLPHLFAKTCQILRYLSVSGWEWHRKTLSLLLSEDLRHRDCMRIWRINLVRKRKYASWLFEKKAGKPTPTVGGKQRAQYVSFNWNGTLCTGKLNGHFLT